MDKIRHKEKRVFGALGQIDSQNTYIKMETFLLEEMAWPNQMDGSP